MHNLLSFQGRALMAESIGYSNGFAFIGNYVNGRPHGTVWVGMKGNGYLHGESDSRT